MPPINNIINEIDNIKTDWKYIIKKNILREHLEVLNNLYDKKNIIIYPEINNIFNCFKYFNIRDTKVIIIGQEPYVHDKISDGLAFSIKLGHPIPRATGNILCELLHEYPLFKDKFNNNIYLKSGSFVNWAKQGVLLLNCSLTSVAEKQNRHHKIWQKLIKAVITTINKNNKHCVFHLWGNYAKKYAKYIDIDNHLILQCDHPSPFTANKGNWFYNSQFRICQKYLESFNKDPIDWFYNNDNSIKKSVTKTLTDFTKQDSMEDMGNIEKDEYKLEIDYYSRDYIGNYNIESINKEYINNLESNNNGGLNNNKELNKINYKKICVDIMTSLKTTK